MLLMTFEVKHLDCVDGSVTKRVTKVYGTGLRINEALMLIRQTEIDARTEEWQLVHVSTVDCLAPINRADFGVRKIG